MCSRNETTPLKGQKAVGQLRGRGQPDTTWHRTVGSELRDLGHSWGTIKRFAKDRMTCRNFIAALNDNRHEAGSNCGEMKTVKWNEKTKQAWDNVQHSSSKTPVDLLPGK